MANMIAGHLHAGAVLLARRTSSSSRPSRRDEGVRRRSRSSRGFAFTLFEIFVAALQAYIFTLLTAVYLSLSVEEEH